jgi:hypothetical protein
MAFGVLNSSVLQFVFNIKQFDSEDMFLKHHKMERVGRKAKKDIKQA